jgi:hypothetical protein
MSNNFELSIANLSKLAENDLFLLQMSKKSEKLNNFIKNMIPGKEKNWLSDLKSWELSNKWLSDISNICLEEYDQVFFDYGDELFDLKNSKNYKDFQKKIIKEET